MSIDPILNRGLHTTISNVTLSIPDVGDRAHVSVEYDVQFSDTDVLTNQAYEETFSLIGDDTGEDGVNDQISMGLVVLPYRTVRPNGAASVHRSLSVYVDWENLNEDLPTGQNPDEIKAKVTLTPILPATVKEFSNVVEKTIVT